MHIEFYQNLYSQSINYKPLEDDICQDILCSEKIELIELLNCVFKVRKKFCGRSVKIHILNNVENGLCSEDCHYCAQNKNSRAKIEKYAMKSDAEILAEAKDAYARGAFRYCMVFAGKSLSNERIEHIVEIIGQIKKQYPLEVCVSTGIIDAPQAKILKKAGLDRINHNLNTSERLYEKICTTHTYQDRIQTLNVAKNAGLQICSGVIIGMGETTDDVIQMAKTLHKIKAESIPINYFLPIDGVQLNNAQNLTPQYCLRVLCLFRLLNPKAEIRVAAGREVHLRSMEIFAFFAANSLFLEGYLNTKGSSTLKTLEMLKDAGFTIEADQDLEELIKKEKERNNLSQKIDMKKLKDLRPKL